MYNKPDFEKMSVEELKRAKKMRIEMIELNNKTGIQSDYDRNVIDNESKRFEEELVEIDKLLQKKQTY